MTPAAALAEAQGQLVILKLRNGRLTDGTRFRLPESVEFTVDSQEVTIPELNALVKRMAPNQRTELTLPAGADLAMLCEPELSPGAPSAALTLEVELCTFRARRIRPGNGERPSPGCLAAAKLWDGQLRGSGPFPMPRVVKLTLGSGDFIPGLEAAVSQMSLGEVAEITIPPLGAYGATGCFAAVPPNATLQVSVELLGFD